MAKVDIKTAKLRLCPIEQEALLALATPITSYAYPRWYAKPETSGTPWWVNRVADFSSYEAPDDDGEEVANYNYTIVSRLIVGAVQADYTGEMADALDDAIPQIVEYLDEREMLQSASYTTMLPYLNRAHFVSGIGFVVTQHDGANVIAADFQWLLEFEKALTQRYLG